MKPHPDLVLVEWEDARTLGGPWVTNEAMVYRPHIVQQVGFLMSDTPEGVILTQAWHPELVAAPDQIPRGMIRKIVPIQPVVAGRKR
jgi:hypothetical protein